MSLGLAQNFVPRRQLAKNPYRAQPGGWPTKVRGQQAPLRFPQPPPPGYRPQQQIPKQGPPQPWLYNQNQPMQQPSQKQQFIPQQPGQPAPYNVNPTGIVVEQPPPPKVIFMPPEVHYGPPPKELLEAQTQTVLRCQGTPHTVTGDQQFYSCCNDKIYYWKNEICDQGVVRPVNAVPGMTAQLPQQPPPPPQMQQPVQQMPMMNAPLNSMPGITSLICDGSTFYISAAEQAHYGKPFIFIFQ